MPRVTLVGYRGVGKSTVGRALARRLSCDLIDADEVLEERCGCSISELVTRDGEPAFREFESRLLGELLVAVGGVLATGGGVVLGAANRRRLRDEGRPVIWLSASPDVVRRRLTADPGTASRRPALAGGDDPLAEVDAALQARIPLYREVADSVFDTSHEPPEVVAERLAEWLAAGAPPDARHGNLP